MSDIYSATYEYPGVWTVYGENDEGHYLLFGIDEDQARYATTILNAGGVDTTLPWNDLRYEIEERIERIKCWRCGVSIFAGQADPDGRCPDCQP